MSRRTFCYGAGAAILAASMLGCGGHGGSPSPRVASVPAQVNLSEIGGTGLTALTTDGTNPLVSSSGSFVQPVSQVKPQTHLLVDGNGKLRSLAVTTGPGTKEVVHDAQSTATTLVFMTLGILSSDPQEATARIAQIQGFSSFAALESYLATNLGTTSINDLGATSQASELIAACIGDFTAANPANRARDAGSSLTVGWSGNSVVVSNAGWRYVKVVRQDLDGQSNDLGVDAYGSGELAGTSASVGSFLYGTVGKPTTLTDSGHFSLPSGNLAQVKYWIKGLGGSETGLIAPPSVSDQFGVGYVFDTVITYVFLPIVDALSGVLSTFIKGNAVVEALESATLLPDYYAALNELSEAFESNDATARKAAISNILALLSSTVNSLLPTILKAAGQEALVEAAGLVALEGALTAFFAGAAVGFGVLNLGIFLSRIASYPDLASYSLNVSSVGGTVS